MLRNLDIENNQVTAGQSIWSIKVSADYDLSRNLTALFFMIIIFQNLLFLQHFPKLVLDQELLLDTISEIK